MWGCYILLTFFGNIGAWSYLSRTSLCLLISLYSVSSFAELFRMWATFSHNLIRTLYCWISPQRWKLSYYTRNNNIIAGKRTREAVATLATLPTLGILRKLETAGGTFSLSFCLMAISNGLL
jgi:hypothetical protein